MTGFNLKLLACSTAIAAILSSHAYASDMDDSADTSDAASDIIVTSTRVATTADRVGHSLTVFGEADIEKSQAVLLTDMLIQAPGVSLTRVGGMGQASSIRIRGGDVDHVVLVVDGVKMTNPASTGGGSEFSEVTIGDISRIEILRGPQSTLWGSQALSGVVSITTAEAQDTLEGSARFEVGTRNTINTNLAVGGKTDTLSWRVAGGYVSTDGISSLDKRLGGVEPDGFTSESLNARISYRPTSTVSLDLRGFYSNGRADLDDISGRKDIRAYTLMKQIVGYAGLGFDLMNGNFKNRVSYQYTEADGSRNEPERAVSVTRDTMGRTKRAEYQGILSVHSAVQLAFGAETQDVYVRYSSPTNAQPRPVPRENNIGLDSLYGQLQLEPITGLTLTGGIRYDDHQTFGSHSNGQVSGAWRLNGGSTMLRASWGQGFNAPTAYQLYDARYGNPDVKPEEAKSNWDASIEQHLFNNMLSLTAGYFHTKTRNLIVVTNCTAAPRTVHCLGTGRPGFYDNVERARAKGVELQAALRLSDTSLTANYTYTKGQDAGNGRDLARTPRHTVNATLDHMWFDRLRTAVTARYVGDSYNDAANRVVLAGFLLVGARISFDLNESTSIYARVDNAFNKYYVTNLNYGTEGRSANIGFRAKF